MELVYALILAVLRGAANSRPGGGVFWSWQAGLLGLVVGVIAVWIGRTKPRSGQVLRIVATALVGAILDLSFQRLVAPRLLAETLLYWAAIGYLADVMARVAARLRTEPT